MFPFKRLLVGICCLTFIFHPLLATAQQQPPPRGWSETTDSGVRLVSNGKASIEIGPWKRLDGMSLREWANALAKQIDKDVTILSTGAPKIEDRTDGVSLIRDIEKGSRKFKSVIYLCPGKSDTARKLEMLAGHKDLLSMLSGGLFMERVCMKEPKANAKQAARAPIKKQRVPIPNQTASKSDSAPTSRPTFKAGQAPKGFDKLWFIAWQGMGSMGFTPVRSGLATFKNGVATRDVDGLLTNGLKKSKAENPEEWGQWRLDERGEIEFKRHGKNKFKEYFVSSPTISFGNDGRLTGCYTTSSMSSTQAMGENYADMFYTFRSNTWCFDKNGRFSNDRALSLTGSSSSGSSRVVHAGQSTNANEGWYRIDGHVIQFVYIDGRKGTSLIGDMPPLKDRMTIILGDRYLEDKSRKK